MEENSKRHNQNKSDEKEAIIAKIRSDFELEKKTIEVEFEKNFRELKGLFEKDRENYKSKIEKFQIEIKKLTRKLNKSREGLEKSRQGLKDKTNQPCIQ